MEQNREPEISSHIYGQLIFKKLSRTHNVERTTSLISCVGKTGYPHAKEFKWTRILYHLQKSTQNGLKA